MKIPKPPFHETSNALLYALLTGGECAGFETLLVDADNVSALNPPENSVYALLVMEADETSADKSRVGRFREDGEQPTALEGIPLGDLTTYEVKGKFNLLNFLIIGIEAGKVHSLRVQYFY
jgi:hypothetical protein